MSRKGGQSRPKDGGAHGTTHGPRYFISTDGILVSVTDKGSYLVEQNGEDNGGPIQDGDGCGIVKNGHVGGLEQLLPSDGEDDGDMVTFETTVADSNVEWIRTKVSNLGNIFNDGLDLGDKVKDICELLDSPSGSESIITSVSDTSGLVSTAVIQDVNKNNAHSSPSSPTQSFLHLGRSRSFSDGGDRSTLNPQDRACLEEIEKGSQLSPEDKELFESKTEELRALELEIQKDKNDTLSLMTPQELESMPEQGIEFEESVGPKQSNSDETATTQTLDFTNIEDTVLHIPEVLSSLSGTSTTDTQTLVLSSDEPSNNVGCTSSENHVLGKNVATISIATDKSSNLTQILINTKLGQQVFQINSSDLTQPATLQSLLKLDKEDTGEDTTGITVRDGKKITHIYIIYILAI